MKNNFDTRLAAIFTDPSDHIPSPDCWDKHSLEIPDIIKQIKAEIAAQMPKRMDNEYDALHYGSEGYNQAIQQVKEALQLEGEKE